MKRYDNFTEDRIAVVDIVQTAAQSDQSQSSDMDVEQGFSNPLASQELQAHHSQILEDHSAPLSAVNGHRPSNGTSNKVKTDNLEFDQIEVSLVDDAGAGVPDEVLVNASDFFLEHNDNYNLTWREASHQISEVAEDPSRPPIPGWNVPYCRWRLRRVIESLFFRVLTLLLIVIDIIIVILDLASGKDFDEVSTYQIIDLIFTIYFVVEIFLRLIALTQPVFFATWYNVVDFAVVLITLVIVIVGMTHNTWAERLSLLTLLRLVRIFRLIRLYTEKQQIETAARQMVSQNKRRYQQNGFDLDLTYVTARVIATSFPSSGLWAWYRNPISRVSKFLNIQHPDRYKIYNLCSEKTYDTEYFQHRVERFMIDDHNVPSLQQMLDFAQSAKSWLNANPENVIVVHCKGGKGRTGTMICVWLVEAGIFTSANQSLEYFGQRRTDMNVSKKFQGVETPSQSRYVGYYEVMKNHLGGQVPLSSPLLLKKIVIRGMMYVGEGNGDDFFFKVDQGNGKELYSAHIGFRRNCHVSYNPERDILEITTVNSPKLDGDVRVLFQTNSKTVPKGYENCPFYFWFNTAFVADTSRKLILTREQLDNPHKPKTWHCFRETFQIEVFFAEGT
ncbi:hypothetical protein TCAL_08699 [Tigriopus californicus]|uniref:Uncharacterized protein n=1 Tax=Tigriopus californicus TaxID=6832 RepID=A0A553NE01_TIGCA|nr:phosphatidylinositol 3,4,5-trisphosphate 3-phosphatase TPTE2-like [Tigriopus californicus]TRY63667.1 hypothetical protein TCAL_08699 [Tigriopus californicus]|eukprot:TCALIF_08699-PA protein Name:"Similar to TPTE2 Phosphatidylinositol 3,4,5-trisphosphate 3-phosphatase TPTE2 (Homo sapiens)" AED:0.09 eAED:0.09 QI:0/-1/0/1/-1/1/1/0/615